MVNPGVGSSVSCGPCNAVSTSRSSTLPSVNLVKHTAAQQRTPRSLVDSFIILCRRGSAFLAWIAATASIACPRTSSFSFASSAMTANSTAYAELPDLPSPREQRSVCRLPECGPSRASERLHCRRAAERLYRSATNSLGLGAVVQNRQERVTTPGVAELAKCTRCRSARSARVRFITQQPQQRRHCLSIASVAKSGRRISTDVVTFVIQGCDQRTNNSWVAVRTERPYCIRPYS